MGGEKALKNASLEMGVHSRSASHRRLSEVTPSFQGLSSSQVGCLAGAGPASGSVSVADPPRPPGVSSENPQIVDPEGPEPTWGSSATHSAGRGQPEDWRSRAPRGWWVRSPNSLPQKVAELSSKRPERRLEIEAGAALTLPLAY